MLNRTVTAKRDARIIEIMLPSFRMLVTDGSSVDKVKHSEAYKAKKARNKWRMQKLYKEKH